MFVLEPAAAFTAPVEKPSSSSFIIMEYLVFCMSNVRTLTLFYIWPLSLHYSNMTRAYFQYYGVFSEILHRMLVGFLVVSFLLLNYHYVFFKLLVCTNGFLFMFNSILFENKHVLLFCLFYIFNLMKIKKNWFLVRMNKFNLIN